MKHAREDYDNIQPIVTNGTERSIPVEEPVFLLRAQDRFAAETVRFWAELVSSGGADSDIVDRALAQADAMDAWPIKKVPDVH